MKFFIRKIGLLISISSLCHCAEPIEIEILSKTPEPSREHLSLPPMQETPVSPEIKSVPNDTGLNSPEMIVAAQVKKLRSQRRIEHKQRRSLQKINNIEPNTEDKTNPIRYCPINQDTRIRVILEDTLYAILSGKLIAVVERDVYDQQLQFILIPAYSKIICHYHAMTQPDELRLPLNCHQIILPNGKTLMLDKPSVADKIGRSGIGGKAKHNILKQTANLMMHLTSQYLGFKSENPLLTYHKDNLTTLPKYFPETTQLTIPAGTPIIISPNKTMQIPVFHDEN